MAAHSNDTKVGESCEICQIFLASFERVTTDSWFQLNIGLICISILFCEHIC